jgi:hypothetical protein
MEQMMPNEDQKNPQPLPPFVEGGSRDAAAIIARPKPSVGGPTP